MIPPPPVDNTAVHTLTLEHVDYQAGERRILKDISLQVASGELVAVIHDLSMAVRCFPRLILLDDGTIAGDGAPTEVLSVETIKRVFGVQARFYQDQDQGVPLLWFTM